MSNANIDLTKMICDVKVEDVFDIKIPAYVVKEVGKEEGGCVVAWNKDFEMLTNFKPSEIDNSACNDLFDIYWTKRNSKGEFLSYKKVCSPKCDLRNRSANIKAGVLRECWINSRYKKNSYLENIKRCVDVYVFPFVSGGKNFALHMLIDRGGVHELNHFNELAGIKPTDS